MSFDYYDKLNKHVPELLPGDVIKASTDHGTRLSYWLVIHDSNLLGIRYSESENAAVLCDMWHITPLKHQTEILKVCRQNGGYNHRELAMIASDEFVPTIYSSNDYKELTVDEVSELLGYTVKIIGEKK
jgi:hypothetical protein